MKKYLDDNEVYSLGELQKNNIKKEDTIELEVVIPNYNKKTQRLTAEVSAVDKENKTYTFGIEDIVYYAVFDKLGKFMEFTGFNPAGRYNESVVFATFKNKHLLDIIDNNWGLDEHNILVRKDEAKISKKIASYSRANISRMFVEKTVGIKKLAINKPNIKVADFGKFDDYGDYVNEQYDSYKELYFNAKNASDQTVETEAIVNAHESAIAKVASLVTLSNQLRAVLFAKVEAGLEVFDLMDIVDAFKLADTDDFNVQLDELMVHFA